MKNLFSLSFENIKRLKLQHLLFQYPNIPKLFWQGYPKVKLFNLQPIFKDYCIQRVRWLQESTFIGDRSLSLSAFPVYYFEFE